MPRRFAVGDAEPEYPDTPYDYFKPIYYEALDLIINCIKSDLISQGTRFTARCSNYCSNQLRETTTKMNCSLIVRSFYGAEFLRPAGVSTTNVYSSVS